MTSAVNQKMPMTTNHEGDIPDLEWIAFGDNKLERSLFLFHHQDDEFIDRFYQMRNEMTVFGFGRNGLTMYLDMVPQSFSIGLLETTDHAQIEKELKQIFFSSSKKNEP